MNQICKTLCVEIVHGRPYHPQSQGKDERFNQTLEIQLGKWMTENKTNRWIDVLNTIVLCDNTTGTPEFDDWFDTVLFRHQQLQLYVQNRLSKDAIKTLDRLLPQRGIPAAPCWGSCSAQADQENQGKAGNHRANLGLPKSSPCATTTASA